MSVTTNITQSSSIVTTITSILKNNKSKSRYTQISSLLLTTSSTATPLSPSQLSLITLSLLSNPRLSLSFFHYTLKNKTLFTHSLSSHSSLLHSLSRSRSFVPQTLSLFRLTLVTFPNQPLTLLRSLIDTYRQFRSAPVVFDFLVLSVLGTKRFDLAAEIARRLIVRGDFLTIRTRNEVLRCGFIEKGSLFGWGLFKEFFSGRKKANAASYNLVLVGFYRDGLVDSLLGVFGEMGKRGIRPNAFSYNILVTAYCGENRAREAGRAWGEMREKGLERDCVAYEAMIGLYCRVGEMVKAEELFTEMEMGGVKGTCARYEHLIKGYCGIGELGSALLLYNDMCRRGFKPEGKVVDVVVSRLCEENKVLEGLELFRKAVREFENVPKVKSFEVLIKGLCDNGMMEEALEVQGEMVGKGFEPNLETYKFFIDGYVKEGNDEMVRRLKKEMVDTKIVEEDDERR